MAIGIVVGDWCHVQKNGSIPYTPLEQLFWRRISNLKKMISSLKGKKHRAYRSMWRGKLLKKLDIQQPIWMAIGGN